MHCFPTAPKDTLMRSIRFQICLVVAALFALPLTAQATYAIR